MEMDDGGTEREKMEMVRDTLQQFMEERKRNNENGKNEPEMEEDLLLSRLLSKLDSVIPSSKLKDSTLAIPENKHKMPSDLTSTSSENKTEEVTDLKELQRNIKTIKRQNHITHNLLTALIVVTMVWQFGEVSIIFLVKEKLTHPVRSIGQMIKGAFTRKGKNGLLEGSALPPPIGGPELTNESFPLLASK